MIELELAKLVAQSPHRSLRHLDLIEQIGMPIQPGAGRPTHSRFSNEWDRDRVSPAEAGSGFLYSAYPGLTPWANCNSTPSGFCFRPSYSAAANLTLVLTQARTPRADCASALAGSILPAGRRMLRGKAGGLRRMRGVNRGLFASDKSSPEGGTIVAPDVSPG
jgi:hypothetical protein